MELHLKVEKEHDYSLEMDQDHFIDNFEDQLVGVSVG